MGRGIDTTLEWPAIKQLANGSWLVDTGSRLKIRQRKRFELKRDADAFASDIKKGFSFDGKGTLSEQQKNEYRLAVSTLGDSYKKVSLVDVVNFYLKMQGITAASKKVREAVPLFIASRRKKSHRYVKQLEFVLGEFCELFGERKPAEITKAELEAFINGRRMNRKDPSKEIAQTTRHNLHRAICAFYKECEKQKWILENPMRYVDAPEPARLSPKILTIDDAKKVLNFVMEHYPDMLGYFALSLFCGIRVQELCRMTRKDLLLSGSKYYVLVSQDVAKNGRPRNVEIPANCFYWLLEWEARARIPVSKNQWNNRRPLNDTDRVVPVSEASVFYRTKLIAKESGVVLPQNVLRHSFASYYYEVTQDAEQTRSRLGHETDQVLFKHYRQLIRRGLGLGHPLDYFKICPPDVPKDRMIEDLRVSPRTFAENGMELMRKMNLIN